MYPGYKRREWILVFVCGERETIILRKFNILIKCDVKINNLMWVVLKSEYVN